MPYTPPIKNMTPVQQQQMLAIAEVGLDWTSGKLNFEDIKKMYGAPARHYVTNEISYAYFPGEALTAEFFFDKNRLINGQPAVKRFVLTVDTYFEPHIRMSDYETQFGLQRLVRGEKIDGVRIEVGDFFNPGRCPNCDRNRVILGYCVFRMKVTGRFGIVTDDFGNVTGRFGNVTERTGQQDWRCA